VTQRLFENDSTGTGDQPILFKPLCNGAEETRRGRKVCDPYPASRGVEEADKVVPLIRSESVALCIVNTVTKYVPLLIAKITLRQVRSQRLFNHCEVIVPTDRASTCRDDAAMARNLPIAYAVIKRRQQLAQCEIAGTAENHQVEIVDRYEICHVDSPEK
jgi:hypothetical protein